MWFCALCLLCSLVCCTPGFAAAEIPPIAVYLEFEGEPSPSALSAMKREIGSIMDPSGLHFEYRFMKDRRSGEAFADLVVLKFKGTCQATPPARYSELGPAEKEKTPLAFTVVSDGKVLPFTDVECDTIRNYIAPSIHGNREARDSALGRAMGRVVAHELFHIFADTTVHAHDGVARSSHSREDLTASRFQFTPHESQMLHDLKALQLKPIPAPPVEAAEVADRNY